MTLSVDEPIDGFDVCKAAVVVNVFRHDSERFDVFWFRGSTDSYSLSKSLDGHLEVGAALGKVVSQKFVFFSTDRQVRG